jgi:hypothetical protein
MPSVSGWTKTLISIVLSPLIGMVVGLWAWILTSAYVRRPSVQVIDRIRRRVA